MEQRFDFFALAPKGFQAMRGVHGYVDGCGLELGLLELLRLRISQMNGCAYCVAMHVPIARQHGVSDAQLNLLAVWREATVFSARERAALAWGEALTRLADSSGLAAVIWDQASAVFSPKEMADLSLAVAEINGWNRLMVGAGMGYLET
ncbi:carboxymuconolactone decarboxylase family protein [Derxia lacustris]|uniref:carboxymuconolactone decarboxylase family protein n=1 Tax=Derxia lacustris TaxID=764842 RepID=UPI000A177281|nr:carboxymuconolactone decarboxylase family protein [Derxia lacustris]